MSNHWKSSCLSLWFFNAFIWIRTGSALLCVSCDSTTDPLCEARPPPPINCTECLTRDAKGQCIPGMENKFCLIVREMDKNGTQLTFSRSCSPFYLSSFEYCEKGIKEVGLPSKKIEIQVCYQSCAEDGCNKSQRLAITLTWALPVIATVGLLTIRS